MFKLLHIHILNVQYFIFRLHAGRLRGCIAKRKPVSTPQIRNRRMRWANVVQGWTVQQNWRHVIFSDEFRVTLFKCDGRVVVWRQEHERFLPQCMQMVRPENRVGVMFWGCIGFGGRGHLVEIDGNMNRHRYIQVLQDHLIPSAADIFRQPDPRFIFQHDNAPPHTARDTVAWMDQQPFNYMQWPAYSPDMNIIETVWGVIMQKLRANPPLTVAALRNRVMEHWAEITPQYLRNLYATLPRRIASLLRARGYPTKY